MRSPLYLIYGVILIGLTGLAEYRGWSLTRVNELRNLPKSIRDNPGAYRAHYMHYPRHIGGK